MSPQQRRESAIDTTLAVWARRRGLAVLVFGAILAGGATTALTLPSIYRSTATVLVERQEMRDVLVRPAAIGELEARLRTIGQEILSRARLEALGARFDLYPELRSRRASEAAVEQLRRDIQVELRSMEAAGGRSATVAFTVSFRGREPETVARVANALASFYVDENVKIRERQATGAAQLLGQQLEETKRRLDEQEARIGDFKRRHVGELPEQVTANLAMLERLNAQLTLNSNNQLRALERRAALAKQLAELGLVGAAAGGDDGVAGRLTRLKLDLAKLRKQYSDKYPDVVQLKAEIAALEQRPTEAPAAAPDDPTVAGIRRSLGELDTELGRLRTEEQRLRRDTATYQRRVEVAPEREEAFRQMSRDYRSTKELYDSMLKRYQDAVVAEDVERRRTEEEFRILDPAIPAREPSAPSRLRLVMLSALLAVGVAAAAVVLAESLDTSFHTLDDLRGFTSVPVVASIPRIVVAADAARAQRRRWLAAASVAIGLAAVVLASYHLARGNEQLVWLLSRTS